MRRSVFLLTPLIPLAVAACEDGPAQTFTPATGTLFNNGNTPTSVDDAGDSLGLTTGGSTKTQICAGPELRQQWGAMINQPIAPVRYMAGLDLDDGPAFPLLTIEKAELGPTQTIQMKCTGPLGATSSACDAHNSGAADADQAACAIDYTNNCEWSATLVPYSPTTFPSRLCQPTVLGSGPNGGDIGGSILVGWGNNSEFQMEWAVQTHKAYVLNLNPGYVGTMTWNARVADTVGGKTTVCAKNADCASLGSHSVCETDTTSANYSLCVTGHAYSWAIGQTIKKDNNPYVIDWTKSASIYRAEVDELYRGIAPTFAPDIFDNAPLGTTCYSTGTCLAVNNAGDGTGRALFGMRPVSFYMFFNPPTLPPPSGYTVQSAYAFNIKYAPYSGAHSYFRMTDEVVDQTGATVSPPTFDNAEPFADGLVGNASDGGLVTVLGDGGLRPAAGKHCHFGMGDTFQNLLDNCINSFSTDAANETSRAKVLGNLAHDDQNFTFSVVGINQNFRPVSLDVCPNPKPAGSNCGTRTQDIIHDDDTPLADPANSLANNFNADVRSFGAILNDAYVAPTSAIVLDKQGKAGAAQLPLLYNKDSHGSGVVWREYARLVQADLAQQYAALHGTVAKTFHDPTCFFPMACFDSMGNPVAGGTTPSLCSAAGGGWTTPPGFDPVNWRPAPGCTGFEGFISAAEPVAFDPTSATPSADPNFPTQSDDSLFNDAWAVGVFAAYYPGGLARAVGVSSFKPGTPTVMFCNDPGSYAFCALSGDLIGAYGNLLDTSTARVLSYLGNGNVLKLPLEARDRRYFFKQWTIAYAKYLTSPHVNDLGCSTNGGPEVFSGTPCTTGVGDISTQPIDTDNLIFDSYGGGASRSEYIDFTYANSVNDPLSVEQKILVLGSNLQATNFYRKLDREERALFNSFATDETQPSWSYLHTDVTDATKLLKDTFATSPSLACTTDADCKVPGILRTYPRAYCNNLAHDPDATHTLNRNVCVQDYPRKNANVFLTNIAGNVALTTGDSNIPQNWHGAHTSCSAQKSLAACTAFGACSWDAGTTKCSTAAGVAISTLNVPAPLPWADPCNAVTKTPQACKSDIDCPGVMACVVPPGGTTPSCQAAKTAYYCAVNLDGDCLSSPDSNGVPSFTPPIDLTTGNIITRDNGKPLLEGYCGVWQPSPLALQPNAISPGVQNPASTPAKPLPAIVPENPNGLAVGAQIVKTFPDEGEALVQLPSFVNPYYQDPSRVRTPQQVMVPWFPYQEGVGYPVAATGTRDVFVQTAQLDFAGQVETAVFDIFPFAPNDPNPNNPTPPYSFQVEAIETQDFLGDVFLCLDPTTSANNSTGPTFGIPGDLLFAHMYTSAETILDWLTSHPGAQDACQIVVRYSPYGNYPDFIQANLAGVRLGVEPGAGFGRITDATVYAPGTGTPAPP